MCSKPPLVSPKAYRSDTNHSTIGFDRQDFGVRYKHRDIPDFIGDEMTVEMFVLTRPAR